MFLVSLLSEFLSSRQAFLGPFKKIYGRLFFGRVFASLSASLTATNCVFDFAETLSFFPYFFFKFFRFDGFKDSQISSQKWSNFAIVLQFIFRFNGIWKPLKCISTYFSPNYFRAIFLFNVSNFAETLSCFAWVLSYFYQEALIFSSLSFFSNCPKKADPSRKFKPRKKLSEFPPKIKRMRSKTQDFAC